MLRAERRAIFLELALDLERERLLAVLELALLAEQVGLGLLRGPELRLHLRELRVLRLHGLGDRARGALLGERLGLLAGARGLGRDALLEIELLRVELLLEVARGLLERVALLRDRRELVVLLGEGGVVLGLVVCDLARELPLELLAEVLLETLAQRGGELEAVGAMGAGDEVGHASKDV